MAEWFNREIRPEFFTKASVKLVATSEFETAAIRSALQDLPSRHRFQGIFLPGSPPTLFASLPKGVDPPDLPVFIPWCWGGTFGAGVSVSTVVGGSSWVRCWIDPAQPGFSTLDAGVLRFAIVQHRHVRRVYEVDYSVNPEMAEWFQALLAHARSYVPLVEDARAHFYEALSHWHGELSADDQLRVGWVREFENRIRHLQAELAKLPAFSVEALEPAPSDKLRRCLVLLQQGERSLTELIGIASAETREHGVWLLTLYEHAYVEEHLPVEVDGCLHMLGSIACIATEVSNGGAVLPLPKIRFLPQGATLEGVARVEIDPENFDPPTPPDAYWNRLPGFFEGLTARLISGRDVPVSLEMLQTAAEQLRTELSISELEASASTLLEEAATNKRAVVPPDALVQLHVGPFQYLELVEIDRAVFFLLRIESGEFFPIAVYVDYQSWWGGLPGYLNAEPATAAVKLLLAAVVRDFWVVEDRETAFRAERVNLPRTQRPGAGPRIVYVPRIRYSHAPDLSACTEALGHHERRAHFVRAHMRRCEHPTLGQITLASKYGLQIPTGYTFVRSHERGHVKRDVIYRSRSALRCLYMEDNVALQTEPVKWFQFERDVQAALSRLGFEVEHVAAAKNGDRGIDLMARKGLGLEEVVWIVQAKCWSKKVGPAVVRDLNGALLHEARGVRGMVITTSSFTTDAKREASETGIRLIDGAEFAALATVE